MVATLFLVLNLCISISCAVPSLARCRISHLRLTHHESAAIIQRPYPRNLVRLVLRSGRSTYAYMSGMGSVGSKMPRRPAGWGRSRSRT
ncbi:hypothetical protein C8Q79DRAFT_931931 [Trametes meyenii]|nr:hypothetical protein C8Q79DRAFT_931931 [Trametes meyenii]